MKKVLFMVAAVLSLCVGLPVQAQNQSQIELIHQFASQEGGSIDLFGPISKYVQAGDCDKLSAWFADNLELDILGAQNNCTRNQARLIMKDFFNVFTPKQFTIIHKSGKAPIKYAVGTLDAGGEKFRMILYVKMNESNGCIQQLKVERE